MPWCVWAQPLHGIRRIFRQFALPRWALVITFTHLQNKNILIFLQHLSSAVASACPPAPERKCAFDWWVWLNKDKILNAWPYVCRMHLSFLAESLEAEPQYPDVFFMLPGERTEMEVGYGWGRRRGGLQSDRLTERSDNERSGLSGVQTASLSAIAARGRGGRDNRVNGDWKVERKVPSQLDQVWCAAATSYARKRQAETWREEVVRGSC